MDEGSTGVANWLESQDQDGEIKPELAKGKEIDGEFFEDATDEYKEGGFSKGVSAFREAPTMGAELLEEAETEKKADGGAVSITPSRVKTEYRTDYKPKSEYRTKGKMKTEDKKKRGVRKGEIITDEEGTEWTVVEKEEGKLQVRNRETGEETFLDEEFLSTEASVFKKAQEEGIIDIEEKIEEEEKGEEKRKEEKEPDVSVEESEEKDEEKSKEKEKSEENIEMGEGIYKEYLMEVVTDPEIAPLVLEKLIRKFEDEDEILSKLESLLPKGEIEDDEYWVKNASVIAKGILSLMEGVNLGRKK